MLTKLNVKSKVSVRVTRAGMNRSSVLVHYE